MARKVADVMWETLAMAGVKRCYGIVGDALNTMPAHMEAVGQQRLHHHPLIRVWRQLRVGLAGLPSFGRHKAIYLNSSLVCPMRSPLKFVIGLLTAFSESLSISSLTS